MSISANDVIDITGTTLCNSKITPFIEDAECIIEKAEECTTVTAKCKDRATTNLAAHYLVTSNVGKGSAAVKSEKLEDVYDVTYAQVEIKGEGVLSTSFGQKANALMNGCLVELDKRPISFVSIGSHPC